jgi:glyoxylase-like metal-dependent hydrolase (beta-lactamase superfamily II)
LFPNAELLMHEAEPAHWRDDARRSKADERKRMYFDTARKRLDAYAGQLRTIAGGDVFPGIEAIPIPGHTPGHTAYSISSGSESLLIWGDIVHVPEVQIARPEVGIAFDTDQEEAAKTRRRILDMVATDHVLVAGMHLNFPGYAHVVRDGSSYALVPEVYRLTP